MRFSAELLTVRLKETFRTSRGEVDEKIVCVVSLGDALGECCPSIHYGYSAEDCNSAINTFAFDVSTEPFDLQKTLDLLRCECGERYSMLSGLDIALYDHASQSHELPLWRYLDLPDPSGRESSYTISIDKPGMIEKRLKNAEGFRILKLKLGCEYDPENLAILGHLPARTIRVDANGAYTLDNIEWLIKAAYDFKLELIEEPFRDPKPADLRDLQKELKCPIIMDESVKTVDDVYKFEDCVGGINIKLQKVGGIGNSLKMIEAARRINMKIMIGCMLETSIGVSASAHLVGAVDFVDLDSIVLLDNDPFDGVSFKDGKLVFPSGHGHGATRINEP